MEAERKAQLGDELYRACSKGDLDAILAFIKHQESLKTSYKSPLPIMMEVATNHDHAHVVSWCLDRGATVDDNVMRTLIGAGAFNTHKVLIEANAVDIDYYITWFGTVLSVAATSGNHAWAKFCLEKGADPNYDKPVDEYKTILAGVAENGKVDIVALLLEHGARLKWSGAIVVAAEAGQTQVVKFLLEKGEDLDINEIGVEHPIDPRETEDMGTALHKAVTEGHKEIVELLVEHGADMNFQDVQGRTPLALARENLRSEIVDLLRDRGAK